MAITKKYLKSKPICKVTFELDGLGDADSIVAVGNFNNWDTKATPLKKYKNGKFKVTVDLEKDNSYEFKYLVDGNYINDEQADEYRWNDFAASDNSVINL
ncbi:isoamylase early set domain-containing protein [Urechidicola croceus]|uniref:Glycoside hydrolase n=1 Tax=Urechidicola croceus TaxID=1850246 RepID=A0A1D8PAW4_9FLAO|nr:isoamylase early set domain-containing protein [Urechidicola croceus]AOW21710.1 glycoside hydrolase [Urechidicola croceus]